MWCRSTGKKEKLCTEIGDRELPCTVSGKIKEISDIRDETDLSGLKITIEYKKSANPDKLMTKLFKMTTLEDSFGCNFNILINNRPKVMGIKEIISNWVDFRRSCIIKRTQSDIIKKQSTPHTSHTL